MAQTREWFTRQEARLAAAATQYRKSLRDCVEADETVLGSLIQPLKLASEQAVNGRSRR